MDNMLYHINAQRLRPGSGASLDILNAAEARRARRFHAGFAQYAPTPLVPLPYLASTLGLQNRKTVVVFYPLDLSMMDPKTAPALD